MDELRRLIPRRPAPDATRQQGIALVVGLVILVILALLGTAAYSVATQEERMAGNARDHARAFQAAEYALRQCESVVFTGPIFDATGSQAQGMLTAPVNGQWLGDSPVAQWQALSTNLKAFNGAPGSAINVATGSSPPLCIAEDFEKGAKLNPSKALQLIPHSARVTAVGYGITTGSRVTLVSYVNYFSTH